MQRSFTQDQLITIMEQAMIYQCTCPSLITRVASDLQHLYDYQQTCINRTDTDREVHAQIAEAASEAYATIEACLKRILVLEQWDLETLKMPDYLLERQFEELENGSLPILCQMPPRPSSQVNSSAFFSEH